MKCCDWNWATFSRRFPHSSIVPSTPSMIPSKHVLISPNPGLSLVPLFLRLWLASSFNLDSTPTCNSRIARSMVARAISSPSSMREPTARRHDAKERSRLEREVVSEDSRASRLLVWEERRRRVRIAAMWVVQVWRVVRRVWRRALRAVGEGDILDGRVVVFGVREEEE